MYHPTRLIDPHSLGRPHLGQGVLAGTQVRTTEGVLPVEFLEPGDRIITRDGALRLMSVTSSWHTAATLIRVCASSLGYDRPEVDLLVAPGQHIVIRDWRAKVLYGGDVASVAASRLVDGEYVRTERLPIARIVTLQFEQPQVIFAEGLELACDAIAPANQTAL
jgi:Hint domain